MVYVVNVTWVNAWLAFVHLLKTSPEPGPCDNTILLERDEENKCWIPLADLVLARKAKRGDYRHVTEETWRHINKLYPGSGPAIKIMSFKEVSPCCMAPASKLSTYHHTIVMFRAKIIKLTDCMIHPIGKLTKKVL